MQNSLHIFIHGNIGCGKTTLSTSIKNQFEQIGQEVIIVKENYEKIIHLQKMYEDMTVVNAILTHIEFMDSFEQQIETIAKQNKQCIYIHDRSFQDVLIFINQMEGKIFSSDEKESFLQYYFQRYQKYMKKFDCLFKHSYHIYVRNDNSQELLKRINERGRKMELLMTRDYLDNLNKMYDENLKNVVKIDFTVSTELTMDELLNATIK